MNTIAIQRTGSGLDILIMTPKVDPLIQDQELMTSKDYGPQPLDALMIRLGLSNADLVRSSTEQLSFKMVQKGRKGLRLTPNVQKKILNALQLAKPDSSFMLQDLFNY